MLPFEPETKNPLPHTQRLTAWSISGNASEQKDFQKRLQTYSFHRRVKRPKNAIRGHGELGQAGELNCLSVPLLPL